jgi:hypothetical protein
MKTMCSDPMGNQGQYNQSTEGGTEISATATEGTIN